MAKFVLKLSNSHGHVYMLCSEVKEEDINTIKEKIQSELKISETYECYRAGVYYPAKDPKILKQLQNITGYEFTGFRSDLSMSFGGEDFDLPGYVR